MNCLSNSKHKGSDLLTEDDNNHIFDLVGRNNCKILSTTVIELHRSPDSSGEGDWTKEEIGVLCLVQDSNRECHFFRIFCLIRRRLVWEHEIRKEIQYYTPKPFLHSFRSVNYMYAFYFVSEHEAGQFAAHMREISTNLLENEQRIEKSKIHEINPVVESPRVKFNNNRIANTSFGRLSTPGRFLSKCLGKSNEKKKKKFTRDDIATPESFKHVSHISEFQEKWCQILRGNKADKSLKVAKMSSSLSESIFPVVKTSNSDAITPPVPMKKSQSRNFSTFVHPSESAMVVDVANLPPPLPEKKSPLLSHRQSVAVSPNLNQGLYDAIGSTTSLLSGKKVGSDFSSLNSKFSGDDRISNNTHSTTAPPLPEKKSPRLSLRQFTSVSSNLNESHYDIVESSVSLFSGKKIIVSDFSTPNSKFSGDDRIANNPDSIAPPLPEKRSPRLNQRRFPPNPSITVETENRLLYPVSYESKSTSLDNRRSHLNPCFSSSRIMATERANTLNNTQRYLNSHFDDMSSSDIDSFSNCPKPPLTMLSEKRKIEEVSHQTDNRDQFLCHYDIVPCRPRPVQSTDSNSLHYSESETDSPSNVNKKEASFFPNSSADVMARRNLDDVQKQAYETTPVTSRHKFLFPPSSNSFATSTSIPSCPAAIVNDPIRSALNAAIKKGVELRRTEGFRRKSCQRENDV